MKEIKLTQDKVTQVDDWNYDFLMQWKWFAFKNRNTWYVGRRSTNKDGIPHSRQKTIYMHCVIMKITNKLQVDHINHNGLNNLESNLRHATRSQNAINSIHKTTSGYRGVYYHIRDKKYVAQININGRKKHLGYFDDPIEAAKKYDKYAKKYHGEFAIINF